jgi:uncharacterized protein YqgC (DUF456 family)
MARLFFGYIIILIGIAGLILPVIPGIILLVIGINLVSEEGGKKILQELKEYRLFNWILAKIEV